jgi:hypothetical protein
VLPPSALFTVESFPLQLNEQLKDLIIPSLNLPQIPTVGVFQAQSKKIQHIDAQHYDTQYNYILLIVKVMPILPSGTMLNFIMPISIIFQLHLTALVY